MDKLSAGEGLYSMAKMPESHKDFKHVTLICSDDSFVADITCLPIGVKWKVFTGIEKDLAKLVLYSRAELVVVCSNGGALISSTRVCEAIRRKINVPLLFINRGKYPDDFDFSLFADVAVNEPKNRRDMLNFGIEVIRLAYDVPVPSVRVVVATNKRSTFRWILTVGAAIAVLSGIITLLVQGDVKASLEVAITTFSAITSVEVGALVKNHFQQPSSG